MNKTEVADILARNEAANPTEPLTQLPLSVPELDAFVLDITSAFNLPEHDHTYEAIATLIMHMPPSICAAPKSYFANSVKKSMANAAAHTKLAEFANKRRNEEDEQSQVNQADTVPVETQPSEPVRN